MMTMGQKVIAFGSLFFIFAVTFVFAGFLSLLVIPFAVIAMVVLWKL